MAFLWYAFAVYVAILLIWIWGLIWIRGLHADDEMQLPPRPDLPADPSSPSLAIFIAAHNEQERIGPCLERLLAQNYGNFRVTVVNDRSDDTTSERARAFMAEDSRVDLIEIDHLPEGWIGKTHALAVAAADVHADYLLFMDCDCRLAPGSLAAVMHKIIHEGVEFVSLWPRLELLSPSERLLTPAASWVLGLWAFITARRGTAYSEVKLGNGQFMIFSNEVYQKIGGHASVQAELAEDMILANKVAELGVKRWAGLGRGLYVTSRDNSLSSTFNAITRVLIGSLVQPWRILLSTQFLLGGVVLPLWIVPAALVLGTLTGETACWCIVAVAVAHITIMVQVVRRLFSMTLEDSPSVFSFMVGSVIVTGLLVRAWLVMTGRQHVRWGKTAYRVQGSQIVCALPEPTQ